MASHRFECHARIDAPRERVHAELCEPARQLGLQPLLVEVRELPAPAPGRRAFMAVERVPLFGGLRLRNRIRVELDARKPACVVFRARSPGGIRVTSEFHLDAADGPDSTDVRESVEVHVPGWLAPLRGFVLRQAAAAQEGLLRNLKVRAETPG